MPRFFALIVAAGSSQRMGSSCPSKVHYRFANSKTVLQTSIASLGRSGVFSGLCVAVRPDEVEEAAPLVAADAKEWFQDIVVAAGGATRQESVRNSLEALRGQTDFVAVHDAARPFLTPAQVRAVCAAAQESGAAILAIPASSTVKRENSSGGILETVPRAGLWLAQTPQVFRFDLLYEAHAEAAKAGFSGTDDSELVEKRGRPVRLVLGSLCNIKITEPEDLVFAEALAATPDFEWPVAK